MVNFLARDWMVGPIRKLVMKNEPGSWGGEGWMDTGKTRGYFYCISPTSCETSSFHLSLRNNFKTPDQMISGKIQNSKDWQDHWADTANRTVLMPQHRMDEGV